MGKGHGQIRSEATHTKKGDGHTSEVQEWGLLLNWLTSGGFLDQEHKAQRLQVVDSGLLHLRRKVG